MDLAFSQRQRFQFIEAVVFWEGAIDRSHVAKTFGVSENHITKDFTLYRSCYPNNLDYDLSGRTYRPGKRFKPQFSTGSSDEYLSLLRATQEGRSPSVIPLIGTGVSAELLPLPSGSVDSGVLKEITRAIRGGSGLRISYQSIRTEDASSRDVWPHALVYAGLRWHVRAFDSKYQDFIDLVPQRIITVESINTKPPKTQANDARWHRMTTVTLTPRDDFTPLQREVIAREFGMTKMKGEWRWRMQVRDCLVGYFLDAMSLGPKVAHLHPRVRLVEQELLTTHTFNSI